MSNLDRQAAPSVCGGRGFVVAEPVRELLSPRTVKLGESTEVRRLLPNLGRRMVGAWCFVDHYGPDDIADEPGMQVAAAPAHGAPDGQLAARGRGAAPRQRRQPADDPPARAGPDDLRPRPSATPRRARSPHARFLHGAQLWVALPDAHRHADPHFEHHADLPVGHGPGPDGHA